MSAPRVLGVDLSLTSTGLADGARSWLLKTTGHRGDSLASRATRLAGIRDGVLAAAAGAALVVVEGPSLGQARQSGVHDRSGAWWHVVGALLAAGIPVAEVPPASLKRYAVGKGNASKDQVLVAAVRRLPGFDGGNDQADASWLAAMALDVLTGVSHVPESHRAALTAVRWPLPLDTAAGAA